MAVYKMESNGLPPNKWPVVKVADVDGTEEFIKQMMNLHRLVDAGSIYDPQRAAVKSALTSILMDGLMPAFLELQQIRASVGMDLPLMNREQPYEDLARKLWKSYSDLMQKASELMGFKLAFLFDNDKKFRSERRNFEARIRTFERDSKGSWRTPGTNGKTIYRGSEISGLNINAASEINSINFIRLSMRSIFLIRYGMRLQIFCHYYWNFILGMDETSICPSLRMSTRMAPTPTPSPGPMSKVCHWSPSAWMVTRNGFLFGVGSGSGSLRRRRMFGVQRSV